NVIQDYAARLRQGVKEDDQIREFRRKFPHRFQELCMLHLSFLVDIPWSIFDQRNGNAQENTPKSALKRLLAVSRIGHQPIKSDPAPEHLVNNALRLIDRLDDDQACSAEGIFRKAGHMQRKRNLLDALLQLHFDPETFPWDLYTVHDLATALKSLIGHLPSPLLTNRLIPLFLRVAGLVEPDIQGIKQSFDALAKSVPSTFSQSTDDLHWNLIRSKQLKALRLLVQLLPSPNRQLFIRLMELLERVIRLQLNNRMTSANLGTVFGPVLFPNELAQNNLNSSKNSIRHSVSIPDLDEHSIHKPGKKRRHTELRLPSTLNRSGPRRHLFSPCPPLGFHPFRKAVVEKRSPSPGLGIRTHVNEIQPLSTW
ncbi:hypothetical protein FBUS_05155, partial [Fasciolopsis buskii]